MTDNQDQEIVEALVEALDRSGVVPFGLKQTRQNNLNTISNIRRIVANAGLQITKSWSDDMDAAPTNERVLLHIPLPAPDNQLLTGRLDQDGFWGSIHHPGRVDIYHANGTKPTHWQPLPTPPEKE